MPCIERGDFMKNNKNANPTVLIVKLLMDITYKFVNMSIKLLMEALKFLLRAMKLLVVELFNVNKSILRVDRSRRIRKLRMKKA